MPQTVSRIVGTLGICTFLLVCSVLASNVAAQEGAAPTKPKFNFNFGGGNAAPAGDLTVTAKFFVQKDSLLGRLVVEAEISPGWHTYSVTQPAGGPMRSKLKVPDSVDYRLTGPFVPEKPPHKEASTVFEDDNGKPLTEETHEGKVVWSAPIELTEGVKPETLEINGKFDGQICRVGACIPKDPKFVAKFAGYEEPLPTAAEFTADSGTIKFRGQIEPATVAPGGKVKLTITATLEDHWHVYHYLPQAPPTGTNMPTLIVVEQPANWKRGETTPSSPPEFTAGANASLPYHTGTVSWVTELEVPATAQSGEVALSGHVGFQTCAEGCKPPDGVKFTAKLMVADKASTAASPLQFSPSKYVTALDLANVLHNGMSASAQPPVSPNSSTIPLPALIGLSLAGGFLLNFMPCVLPVLGLKLMSFAKQGGQSRSRMLAINLSYTAGLMVVFMVLAALSISVGLAWGEQMTNFWFRLGVLIVTFAFALSLFGVWEIPVPGIADSEGSSKLQQQEGIGGAFFKGLFTTILGISCSGPLLGAVLGATLGMAAVYKVLVFASIGLGMASPFLALPFVPGVQKWLPKPGDWMDTFKQIMGFVMIAAAIFFFSTIEDAWKIATLTLLVGVSFACWWIGKVPLYESFGKQFTAWVGGCAAAGVVGVAAFNFFGPPPPNAAIEWKEFSLAEITKAEQENRTVFVDFTADWCANCKTNLKFSIERADVKRLLEQNNVVAMKADWSQKNPELEAELARLKRDAIPLLAIYPAGKPNEVIVLDGLVLKYQVMNAIRQAGPSQVPLEKKLADKETATAKAAGGDSQPAN